MKAPIFAIAVLVALMVAPSAWARDDHHMFPLDHALNNPLAQQKLDKSISLYFGNQTHPKVIQSIGTWNSNKKTNGSNKTDQEACEWAFLSAMESLINRARQVGANAVIDIKSNYKNIVTVSDNQYMCGNGSLMAGVAFIGTMVTLGK
jgi:uncharacterized protein YbjQ (UPF0145 family)